MMTRLGSLTIANGGTTSGELTFNQLRFLSAIAIQGPAALTGTVTVEVSFDREGDTFVALQSGGADVTIPADKVTVLSPIPCARLRVVSSGAEGAERVFPIFGRENP